MKKKAFYCDACGERVSLEAIRCPGCGKFFDAVKCPVCNYTAKAPAFINGCPSCGYLSKQSDIEKRIKSSAKVPKTGPLFPKWTYNVFFIALLCGIIILFIIYIKM